MNCFGDTIRLTVSGRDRGGCIIATLDGLPRGEELDIEAAWEAAQRRGSEAPSERPDVADPLIMGGLRDGRTDGEPLAAVLRVKDEAQTGLHAPRPGHEDLALLSRDGECDYIGGAYSGRINLAVAFAGNLCAQILARRGVRVTARVSAIGTAVGRESDFDMKRMLLDARGTGDSVGSMIECVVEGLPAGLGRPAFGGMESRMAALVFSLPGVKGIEFGTGFGFAAMRGSAANDQIVLRDGCVAQETNQAGGAEAGLTTGMPIVFRAAVRPSPSIGREQRSVDMDTMKEVTLRLRGRHDPCWGLAVCPAVEGAAAVCALDALLGAVDFNTLDQAAEERSTDET